MLKEFFLDEEYLCDVTVEKEYLLDYSKPVSEMSDEDIALSILKHGTGRMLYSDDHPEFTKLRQHLHKQGYIRIETTSKNGDQVLFPFKLNGIILRKGQKFYCAAAMKNTLLWAKKNNQSYLN